MVLRSFQKRRSPDWIRSWTFSDSYDQKSGRSGVRPAAKFFAAKNKCAALPTLFLFTIQRKVEKRKEKWKNKSKLVEPPGIKQGGEAQSGFAAGDGKAVGLQSGH